MEDEDLKNRIGRTLIFHPIENDSLKSSSSERIKNKQLSSFQQFLSKFFAHKFLIVIIVALVVSLIVLLALKSDYFYIKSIDIVNAESDSNSNNKLLYANTPLITKQANSLIGLNYFSANPTQVINAIVLADPFIEKGFFEKQFPAKVVLRLYERKPYLIYEINGTYCSVLDANANVLVEERDLTKCPGLGTKYKIQKVSFENSKNEYKVGTVGNSFVLEKVKILTPLFERYKISIASISIRDNICEVTSDDNKKYTFILDDTFSDEVIRFQATIDYLVEKKIDYKTLDLRYDRPVTEN